MVVVIAIVSGKEERINSGKAQLFFGSDSDLLKDSEMLSGAG